MPRTRQSTLLWSLVLFLAACKPEPAVPISPNDGAEEPQLEPALFGSDEPDDRGPGDRDLPPPFEPQPVEVSRTLEGPAVLYGRLADGARPNAPGRRGNLLVAIDAPYQIFGSSASYLHVAAWTTRGRPAPDASVYIGRRRVGRTDHTGTLVFRYEPTEPDTKAYANSLFVIGAGDRCGAVSFSPYERTKTFATDRLYVYTDRGAYQPGDTVHVRVIGWRLLHDYEPLKEAPVEFLLQDEAGRSVAAASVVTDDFGISATDLSVPVSAPSGRYSLDVAYGTERASTRLQVREFARPSLRIEHTLGRFLVRAPETKLEFAVTVTPPGAEPLRQGEIEVVAKSPEGSVVAQTKRAVSGNGPHAFAFSPGEVQSLLASAKDEQFVKLELRVRDAAGREDKLIRSMRVTTSPYDSVLELDRDQYTTGDPIAVVARISDRDGVPLRSQPVALHVAKASSPGSATPPNKPTQASPQVLEAVTDSAGMARFALTMLDADAALELHVPGVTKPIGETIAPWAEATPVRAELREPVVKERARANVTVRFPAGYSPAERHVRMDMTDTSGGIIKSTLLGIRKEKDGFVARGEFVAPSWGSMLLTFFALGRPDQATDGARPLGLLVGGQNLVVQTDRELQIELSDVPDTFAPGTWLDGRATIRDSEGNPADVSASVAVVDSNILALKDPLEVTPMDRFYNPELRTLAATGAKMLTWPVVTRNWGQARHDVALPPFPWYGGGDVEPCRTHWDQQDYDSIGEGMGGGMGFGSGAGSLGAGGLARMGVRTKITIRTRFPATAVWSPHVRGKGEIPIHGQLPDTIGNQELIIVASDKSGGVGVHRKRVDVSQPVFVEADLPKSLVVSETSQLPVTVHNHTAAEAPFDVEAGLEGRVTVRRQLKVPAGGSLTTTVPFSTKMLGEHTLYLRAVGAGHDDRVEHRIQVVPRGIPIDHVQTGVVSADQPLRFDFFAPASPGARAHLSVDLPLASVAFDDLAEIAASIGEDPWSLAGDLTSAALLLQLAERFERSSPELAELRSRMVAALTMLARVQRPNGGYGYWRNGEVSPFVTARILEGMLEARRAGIAIYPKAVSDAAAYLGEQVSTELVSLSAIGWWEGEERRVQEGITAEIFDVLARLPREERKGAVAVAIENLSARYLTYLKRDGWDPLAAGRSLSALLRLKRIDQNEARAIVERLIRIRDTNHWEPTWFHAYGGRVDLTLAVLEALQLAGPSGSALLERDAVSWILSTRSTWGDWHSDAATAAALRALLVSGAVPHSTDTDVEVRLDGTWAFRGGVGPKSDFLRHAQLAHLDLGRLLPATSKPQGKDGRHRLDLFWRGEGSAPATLVSRTWHAGTRGPKRASGVSIDASGPSNAKPGDAVPLTVTARGSRLSGSTVVLSHSSVLDVDLAALAASSSRKTIADTRLTERGLELIVAPGAKLVKLSVPFRAVRPGTGHLPSVALFDRVDSSAKPLIIDPGPIVVK